MIEQINYGGWENNVKLSNSQIELVVTLDVGPRIIRLATIGGQNLFNEFADQLGNSNESDWQIRGGHRFWHAPEAIPRTYVLDNYPVKYQQTSELSLRVICNPEIENGIQKQIDIAMDEKENAVTLTHKIINTGRWPIELAPWALTVMARGGKTIIPLPKKQLHFDRPNPAYSLTFWSYTDLSDPRLNFGSDYITIDHAKANSPSKWGMNIEDGWVAYLTGNMLFAKKFTFDENAVYPDNGSNFETYSDADIMELETLGPLTKLAPNDSLEFTEKWKIFTNVPATTSEQEIAKLITAPNTAK